jgi:hypothetical protein
MPAASQLRLHCGVPDVLPWLQLIGRSFLLWGDILQQHLNAIEGFEAEGLEVLVHGQRRELAMACDTSYTGQLPPGLRDLLDPSTARHGSTCPLCLHGQRHMLHGADC